MRQPDVEEEERLSDLWYDLTPRAQAYLIACFYVAVLWVIIVS